MPNTMSTKKNTWLSQALYNIVENTKIAIKILYVLASLVFFLVLLLEVKRYYNIDVIPNYDSPIDDWYGSLIGTVSEFFKDLFGQPK